MGNAAGGQGRAAGRERRRRRGDAVLAQAWDETRNLLRWLENFPYRLEAWVLLPLLMMAGLMALAIAWATVGGNAARVASRNPVEALRYE